MKKRLFTLLFALLAILTGAKAADPYALEIYSKSAGTIELDRLKILLGALAIDKQLYLTISNRTTTVSRVKNGPALFSFYEGKSPGINVPTSVTSSQDFTYTLSKTALKYLIDNGISSNVANQFTTMAVKFQIAINETNFKDATFRAYVSENFDTEDANSGRLTKEECAAVKKIDVTEKGITSLKGVEYFTGLKELYCGSNQLTALDLSKNTALTHLKCMDNNLTTLDLSKNSALTILYCQNNQLPTLDLSKNTALNTLGCIGNPIDAEGMSNLVAHLPTTDDGWFYALDQNQTMYVSLVLSANNKGWTIYKLLGGNKFVEYAGALVEISTSNFPDDTFREYVSNNFDTNKDGYLNRDEIMAVTIIRIENDRYVRSLKGIEFFTRLGDLSCEGCGIPELDVSNLTELSSLHCNSAYVRTLDVSGCTNLRILACMNNELTTLDVSTNTMLEKFACYTNELTTLNVSKNTKLKELWCENNKLTSLDVSKNTELNLLSCSNNQLTSLEVSKNAALTEIWCYKNNIRGEGMDAFVNSLPTVENGRFYVYKEEDTSTGNMMTPAQVKIAKDKGWNPKKSDGQAYLGDIPIEEQFFPDENFRTWLTAQSYGSDGVITDDEIANITKITARSKSIASVKGIEYFSALTNLDIKLNRLEELDVSKNTALRSLSCTQNKLSELDVSQNTALEELDCKSNNLKVLDVSKNKRLSYLDCSANQLFELDLKNNNELQTLYCSENVLVFISLSPSNMVTKIDCYLNKIKATEMGNLVNSLPTVTSGTLRVFNLFLESDDNVITSTQVRKARSKGWAVLDSEDNEYGGIPSGDMDGDGELTSDDFDTIRDYILGKLPEGQSIDLTLADMNDDGVVDILDLTQLIKLLVKTETEIQSYLQCPDDHHPHAIDLGLPSGTKWACCNVGADKPGSYGNYLNWDVNTVQNAWGSNWQMPSKEQMQEIIDNTTMVWTPLDGVNGLLVTGSNGGSMFLPTAGLYATETLPIGVGTDACYWSSTPDTGSKFWGLAIRESTSDKFFSYEKAAGLPIRPVTK